MNELTWLFGGVALTAGLLASVAIWSPRRPAAKLGALGATAALLPAIYLGFVHLLSMPKPVAMEWWHARAAEATVLGTALREGEAIYVWLDLEEADEPRAYVLPWDRDLAEQLQTASREAQEKGGAVRMRLPFEPSLDQAAPRFYAMPQAAAPAKGGEATPPLFYDREAGHEA